MRVAATELEQKRLERGEWPTGRHIRMIELLFL